MEKRLQPGSAQGGLGGGGMNTPHRNNFTSLVYWGTSITKRCHVYKDGKAVQLHDSQCSAPRRRCYRKPKAVHINNNDDNNNKQSNSQNVNVQIIIIPEQSDGARSSHTHVEISLTQRRKLSWSFTRHLDPTGRQNNGLFKTKKRVSQSKRNGLLYDAQIEGQKVGGGGVTWARARQKLTQVLVSDG